MELKNYQIIQEIGEGAFSKVFKAQNLINKEFCAIKEIEFERLNEKQKHYANEEIRILKRFRNPFIISYHSHFSSGSNLYIVMELAEQGDLQKKIEEHKEKNEEFSVDVIWRYFFQILSALKALHDSEIIHRDIKPANIFITKEGNLKLGDFNVGKENVKDLVKTRIGTPLIMSPEVLQGKEYSNKTDIWSLGCVIYELATLKRPYEADYEVALYQKVKKMKIKVPRCRQIEKIVKKMMRHKPEKRPSCNDLINFEEFRRFRNEPNRKASGDRKVNQSFRAPSLNNLSINRDLSIRKNLHESPSGRKLRNFSQKNLKAISCERGKITHKASNENLVNRQVFPVDSPEHKSLNKSKISKDLSLKLVEFEKAETSKYSKNLDFNKNLPKVLRLPLNLTSKLSANKVEKEFKTRFQMPESGSVTALSAPRMQQVRGAYLNDIYIVNRRRKKSRVSLNSTNTAATPKSVCKGLANPSQLFQSVAK